MEIQGRIIKVLPEVGGVSKSGNEWRKQEYILETPGQYPRKVCFNLWGDRIDQFRLQEGEEITAQIDIESREFNERWYTDVRAYNIQRGYISSQPPMPQQGAYAAQGYDQMQQAGAPNFPGAATQPASDPMAMPQQNMGDDLPF